MKAKRIRKRETRRLYKTVTFFFINFILFFIKVKQNKADQKKKI